MDESTVNTVDKEKKHHKRPWAFPLGILIFALAIYGIISLLSLGFGTLRSALDKTALKAEYEAFLAPVVRNDPHYFEDLKKAKNTDLLDSAIWLFLKDGGLIKKEYDFSETDPIGFIVPAKDLEWAYRRLFGNEFEPDYETVYGPEYTFTYVPAKKSYIISVTSADPLYLPKVEKIEKKGDSTVLTVGYINSHKENFVRNKKGEYSEPSPDKYVKITLRGTDGEPGYYVSAIEGLEAVETATFPDYIQTTAWAEIPTHTETTEEESADDDFSQNADDESDTEEVLESSESTEPSSNKRRN